MTDEHGHPAPVQAPARATIHDVARAAGVTIGTVSKALNGRGQLRAETRQRVLDEAARLEFRPNDLVKSLLRGRTYTVGLLTTDFFGRFVMPLLAGVEDALGAAEILVFLCNIRDDPERERRVIASLLAKGVDGLIVAGRRTDPRPPIDVGRSRVPVVYANTRVDDPAALCLLPDDAGGARLAVEHLVRAGRRRIAHVTGPAHWEAVQQRRAGMTAVLAEHGLALPEHRVLHGPWREGWGYDGISRLLEREPEIDAVFCGSDLIARGAMDGLRENGRRIPEDVAVVGFDDWEIVAEAARPPLTTVDLGLHEIGREASARLLSMLNGGEETGAHRLPCRLVVRESCGGPRPGDLPGTATERATITP
jgi:LacI family transcriptional regulator